MKNINKNNYNYSFGQMSFLRYKNQTKYKKLKNWNKFLNIYNKCQNEA